MADAVAVVLRPVRREAHHHRLGADRQRPREDVEALDALLQVHEPLPRLVVLPLQVVLVRDPADADPRAAVVGLHPQRVADLRRDLAQVERRVVLRGGVREAGVVRRLLGGHQPRLGHLQPQSDHRAVRRVLLHRLEREGVVEQVDVVHQRELLQPLARDGVPVRQAVDDQAVAAGLAQVEWLDGDALDVVAVGVGADPQRRVEAAHEGLEGARPVLLRPEQQAQRVRAVGHGPPPDRCRASDGARQVVGRLRPPGRPGRPGPRPGGVAPHGVGSSAGPSTTRRTRSTRSGSNVSRQPV